MKNYEYDIKYVNRVNFIVNNLLRPTTKTALVFDNK